MWIDATPILSLCSFSWTCKESITKSVLRIYIFCTLNEFAFKLSVPLLSGANDILDVLDLSWNHIRGKGAIAVAKGIGVGGVRSEAEAKL